MVDINKYLESQLALAKQKCDTKTSSKKSTVSEKSKVAAELISKKQDKTFVNKKCSNSKYEPTENVELHQGPTPSTSAARDSDEGSDYLPSGDEEGADIPNINVTAFPSTSQSRQNLKKIIDDGDTKLYNERLDNWKKNLAAAQAGKYEGDSMSADIHYVLNGSKNVNELHELQNGLNVPTYIWKQLYKYQKIGVKWLWELHQVQSGGLLGDEMGLGKTVQIIAFLAGLSKTHLGSWGGLGPSIIVAPATVIFQWVTHFHYWCPYLRVAVLHHSGSHSGNHNKLIRNLHDSHGILLITYAGVVKYSKDLMARRWHYMILDEGHKIRNPDTQVSKLVKQFQTPHKVLITGCPMQNSLQELWSLFDFMRPGLLGTYNAFMEHFAQPITQGGYANATEFQEATALEIAKALKSMITPYMLRRTKAEVQDHIKLPEKNEQVLFCAMSQEQRDLYMGYLMSSTVRSILDKESRYGDPLRARVLVALSTLRKLCNHPDLYLYEAQEECEQIDESFGSWKRSGKMTVVHSLLKIWQKQGHRTLIFSQSRAMLCILEQYLQNQDYKYLKMDGTVSVGIRQNLIKTFNENSEYLVFLATTRVGGLGVNLTGADRVIIYDPDWNPATDSQAKERAWRIGQLRKVTVYRLLSGGTIEEKIYQRQIFKHFLSNKILIDPNQKNVLTTSTLQGLFTFEEPNCDGDTETAALFKHTKVNVSNRNKDTNNQVPLNGGFSMSKKKLEEMRRRAREISRKISSNVKPNIPKDEEDPREKYKKKRDLILNPPVVHLPEINLIDDNVTNIPFDSVLSELDIINMHSKKDYEENLLKEALKKNDTELEEGELSGEGDDIVQNLHDINNLDPEMTGGDEDIEHTKESTKQPDNVPESNIDDNNLSIKSTVNSKPTECVPNMLDSKTKITNKHHKSKRKRKHSSDISEPEIENLIAVKRVKKKKDKREKEKHHNDDDYVLSKLFAKAGVKNALQHDVVVGLAEKEKRHSLKEEATKKAKHAVRAIKFSSR